MGRTGLGSRLRLPFILLMAAIVPACGGSNNSKGPASLALPPTGLVATAVTTARIDLTWVDASDNEFEFRIERGDVLAGPFTQVGTALMNTTGFSDTGLQPNKQYFYRVTAWNALGNSTFAGPLAATTSPLMWASVSMTGGPGVGRGDHSAIYDSLSNRMLVFGGVDDGLTVLNELWSLNLAGDPISATPWSSPATTGTAPDRLGHSAIYDSANHRMIVFGGQDGTFTPVDTVHILNLTAMVWSTVVPTGSAPAARAYHTAIYDSANQQMVVYGGNDGIFELADCHFLSLPAAGPLAWSTPAVGTPPLARSRHASIYDPLGTQMAVFAGIDMDAIQDRTSLNNETWSFDTSAAPSWSQLLISGVPSFRMGHSAVYDASNRRMVIFGGAVTTMPTTTRELWAMTLDGVPTWTNLGLTGGAAPASRMGHTAVYDSANRRMIIYGGFDDLATSINDVWVIKL